MSDGSTAAVACSPTADDCRAWSDPVQPVSLPVDLYRSAGLRQSPRDADSQQPDQQGSQPSQQDSRPPQQGSQPPQKGSQPYQQGSQPPQQGSQPSQQGSQPPQQDVWSYYQGGQPCQQDGQPCQQDGQPGQQDVRISLSPELLPGAVASPRDSLDPYLSLSLTPSLALSPRSLSPGCLFAEDLPVESGPDGRPSPNYSARGDFCTEISEALAESRNQKPSVDPNLNSRKPSVMSSNESSASGFSHSGSDSGRGGRVCRDSDGKKSDDLVVGKHDGRCSDQGECSAHIVSIDSGGGPACDVIAPATIPSQDSRQESQPPSQSQDHRPSHRQTQSECLTQTRPQSQRQTHIRCPSHGQTQEQSQTPQSRHTSQSQRQNWRSDAQSQNQGRRGWQPVPRWSPKVAATAPGSSPDSRPGSGSGSDSRPGSSPSPGSAPAPGARAAGAGPAAARSVTSSPTSDEPGSASVSKVRRLPAQRRSVTPDWEWSLTPPGQRD